MEVTGSNMFLSSLDSSFSGVSDCNASYKGLDSLQGLLLLILILLPHNLSVHSVAKQLFVHAIHCCYVLWKNKDLVQSA